MNRSGRPTIAPSLAISRNRPGATTPLTGRGAAVGHDGSGFVAVAIFGSSLNSIDRVPTALRPPGAAGPDPAEVPAVPVPGPGRPAVLVHAARTGRNTAAGSRRRLMAMAVSR